jgi:hypothetical protein
VTAAPDACWGAGLCNQVTYELLHYLTIHQLDVPAGFVHVPALPEQVTNAYPPMPSMALETMTRGIYAVIGALQAPPYPRRSPHAHAGSPVHRQRHTSNEVCLIGSQE